MINQDLSVTPTKTRQLQFPSTVTVAGTPMLFGALPCVNLDSYQATIGGATCYFDGAYFFTVVAKSSLSPSTNHVINPGDKIYAVGGTLDTATGITTGFTLCGDSSGVLFGTLNSQSQPLTSGTTGSVSVDISL